MISGPFLIVLCVLGGLLSALLFAFLPPGVQAWLGGVAVFFMMTAVTFGIVATLEEKLYDA